MGFLDTIKRVGDVITPGFDIPGESERRARRQVGKHYTDLPGYGKGPSSRGPVVGTGFSTVPGTGSGGQDFNSGLATGPDATWEGMGGATGIAGILKKTIAWVKKNPELALSLAATLWQARRDSESDALVDEAVDFTREDRERLHGIQDRLLGDVQGISAVRPDLRGVFSDPSNPFYTGVGAARDVPPDPSVPRATPPPTGGKAEGLHPGRQRSELF